MKQTLQLKLSQHLTLTPQLQQSIRLLQLSTIELNQEVERLLQENPLLERADGEEEGPRPEEIPLAGPNRVGEAGTTSVTESAEAPDAEARGSRDDAPEISDFTDYGSSGGGSGDGDWGGSGNNEDDDFYPQQVATDSLRDH